MLLHIYIYTNTHMNMLLDESILLLSLAVAPWNKGKWLQSLEQDFAEIGQHQEPATSVPIAAMPTWTLTASLPIRRPSPRKPRAATSPALATAGSETRATSPTVS